MSNNRAEVNRQTRMCQVWWTFQRICKGKYGNLKFLRVFLLFTTEPDTSELSGNSEAQLLITTLTHGRIITIKRVRVTTESLHTFNQR